MSAPIASYLALITSQHADKPDFLEVVGIAVQPNADESQVMESLPGLFDLDAAAGVQLDAIGERVNIGRRVGGVPLGDAAYKRLIRATVIANRWDGTIPMAYDAWQALFTGQPHTVLIQDNQDMSMTLAIVGDIPDAGTEELFSGGYLRLKPAGVRIDGYAVPTVPTIPLFGFDLANSNIAGFDIGAWARFI